MSYVDIDVMFIYGTLCVTTEVRIVFPNIFSKVKGHDVRFYLHCN